MIVALSESTVARDDVEILTSLEQFDALASCWSELGVRGREPTVSHAWFSCAARHLCAEGALHAIAVRRAGRLVGIAPLCRVRHAGVQWLEMIGDRALFEPLQLPVADDQALVALSTAIVAQGLPVCLQRLTPDDPCVAALRSAATRRGTLRVLPRTATHYIAPATDWSLVHGSMSDYRRKKRKLEAQGVVRTSILAPTAAELEPLLDDVFRVEASGWKGRRGSSLRSNPALGGFFLELCARFAVAGILRICLLQCSERTIAAQICVEDAGRFWVLKMGFDNDWARFSPGMLLTSDTIRHALEERQLGFEFLGVAEQWQQQWKPRTRMHCAAVYYPASLAGGVALAMHSLARVARLLRKAGSDP